MFKKFSKSTVDTSKTAGLHALRANVMIADSQLNITYMNPAAVNLMRDAEDELKAELPRFSVANLIGSNIDIFHKNPGHQRKMLAALDKPHNATIRVGTRVFDLLVSPLFDKGQRIGFGLGSFRPANTSGSARAAGRSGSKGPTTLSSISMARS